MNRTQHDLSCDQTKLDYQALVRTADIAFAHTRNELERCLHRTHDIPEHNPYREGGRIYELAEQLSIVAETAHTLREGLTRSQLEIVNKPEVKDD